MGPVENEILIICSTSRITAGLQPIPAGLNRREYLRRLILKCDALPDEEWVRLSHAAQLWNNAAVTASKTKRPLPEPDGNPSDKPYRRMVMAEGAD